MSSPAWGRRWQAAEDTVSDSSEDSRTWRRRGVTVEDTAALSGDGRTRDRRRKTAETASPEPSVETRRSARDQALSLLEYADRTEKELVRKLQERGYAWEEIQDAVSFLLEYRYLDDRAYADRYVRARSSRKSRRQLQAELEQKGIASQLIQAALEEETVDEEGQIRRFLEKKGCHPGEKLEPQQLRRITAALARKGFSYDQIRSVMELPL